MKCKNNLSITFGIPDFGWLPVVFHYNEFHLEMGVSNVLNDPLDELKDLVDHLEESHSKRITWWLEAPAYYFDFQKKDDAYFFKFFYVDDIFDNKIVPKLIWETSGNKNEIIEPFRRGLHDFSKIEFDKRHWYSNSDEEE